MKRYLSKKEIRELLRKYLFIDWIKPKDKLYEENNIIYSEDGKPLFVKNDNELFPTLELIMDYYEKTNSLPFPTVIVDRGATKYILNGADVMRPGITELDDFDKDSLVLVLDEEGNLLALGKALFSSEEIKKMQKGKVIKNLLTWMS